MCIEKWYQMLCSIGNKVIKFSKIKFLYSYGAPLFNKVSDESRTYLTGKSDEDLVEWEVYAVDG